MQDREPDVAVLDVGAPRDLTGVDLRERMSGSFWKEKRLGIACLEIERGERVHVALWGAGEGVRWLGGQKLRRAPAERDERAFAGFLARDTQAAEGRDKGTELAVELVEQDVLLQAST